MATEPTVEDLFLTCQRSVVHLEFRDQYSRNDPLLDEWRRGVRHAAEDWAAWWNDWYKMMFETTRRGVVARRARIVSEPVSEYVRFEYDLTSKLLAVGEDVRWLPRRQATDLALPGNDCWLFDGEVLFVTHFSGEGDRVDREYVPDPEVTKLYVAAFESVWDRATPHKDYQLR